MTAVRIGIVGLGKIAHDKHIPAIASLPDFEIVAGASHAGSLPNVPTHKSLAEMLAKGPKLDAVALCQPTQARFHDAWTAIEAGCHVLLEKPPGATVAEVELLGEFARREGITLFASWHARFAPAVASARAWLECRCIQSVNIVWKEDVQRWHPGQTWIWDAGGLGVFDPGINALSIASRILPQSFYLVEGVLSYPSNKAAPIAADLTFATSRRAPIRLQLDWRETGPQTWRIEVATDDGTLVLDDGGCRLSCAGEPQKVVHIEAYPALYRYFSGLISNALSDVDVTPLRHVADAFMRSERREVAPFEP